MIGSCLFHRILAIAMPFLSSASAPIAGGANITVISGTTPSALAYDVSSDRFYGLSVGGGNIQLLNVNETTGVTSNIGSTFTLATWDQDFTIDPATGMGYLTGRTAAMGSTERALFAIGLADGSVSQSVNFDFATLDLANNPNALVAASTGPGDYNGDGIVNAADYVIWRKGLDATYTQDDYNVWRQQLRSVRSRSFNTRRLQQQRHCRRRRLRRLAEDWHQRPTGLQRLAIPLRSNCRQWRGR